MEKQPLTNEMIKKDLSFRIKHHVIGLLLAILISPLAALLFFGSLSWTRQAGLIFGMMAVVSGLLFFGVLLGIGVNAYLAIVIAKDIRNERFLVTTATVTSFEQNGPKSRDNHYERIVVYSNGAKQILVDGGRPLPLYGTECHLVAFTRTPKQVILDYPTVQYEYKGR